MRSSQPKEKDDSFFGWIVPQALLGIAYVVGGIALFYSISFGSTEMQMVALTTILVLIAVSLVILVAREGLVTAENELIGVFVLVAIGLLFGLTAFTDLPEIVVYSIVIGVGLLVPNRILKHADDGRNG